MGASVQLSPLPSGSSGPTWGNRMQPQHLRSVKSLSGPPLQAPAQDLEIISLLSWSQIGKKILTEAPGWPDLGCGFVTIRVS